MSEVSVNQIRIMFRDRLKKIYPVNEIDSICKIVCEDIEGGKGVRILEKDKLNQIESVLKRLEKCEPIQYVLGKAFFYDLIFQVTRDVLIPRQETELLVHEIIRQPRFNQIKTILDIGTGSGCIAITLKKNFPHIRAIACDISEQALEIAIANARQNETDVEFFKEDIFRPINIPNLKFDLIVSNPPYVRESEKELMHNNVKGFEPGLALFVPDSNPLIFYKAIAAFGRDNLNRDGYIVIEINEALAKDTSEVFEKEGFGKAEILKDLNNKDRILIISNK